jgi:AraC-like DNA-binding protein
MTSSTDIVKDSGLRSVELQAQFSVVSEADGYSRAVEGVEIEVARTGAGIRPTEVRSGRWEGLAVSSVDAGFPMLGRAAISDEVIIVARIRSAPPGTRWCGIDLDPGDTLVYGPGALHTSVNPIGTSFAFAAVQLDELARMSDFLGASITTPLPGEVFRLPKTPAVAAASADLDHLFAGIAEGILAPHNLEDDLLSTLASHLASEGPRASMRGRQSIDDREVVHSCLDLAEAMARIPSISELCAITFISERRLRRAFVKTCGASPGSVLRNWALSAAHNRLLTSSPGTTTVTDVAMDLGFNHLGRFAARYQATYGERPSDTLRSRRVA